MKSTFLAAVVLATFPYVQAIPEWGQCAGNNWNGGGSCDPGLTCVYFNDWYSQCQKVDNPPPTSTQPPPSTSSTPGNNNSNNLSSRFKAKGKKYWGTVADSGLLNNQQNVAVIKAQSSFDHTVTDLTIAPNSNQVTAENSMKWDSIHPSSGSYNYGGPDQVVNFAQSNDFLVRGHTFVWHSQLPGWVSSISSSSTLTSTIQSHISNVGGRYRGKVYAWDVCNEILNENGSMRSSVFYNVLGESFVSIAFNAARQADGDAKLYINDYNLDSVNSKVNGMVSKVRSWRSSGVPIDGIGTQAHLEANGAGGLQAAVNALAGTGVSEVAITELDIKYASSSDYVTAMKACLQVSACVGITSWGTSDRDSWRSSYSPLLFDSNYQPKAAYTAIMNALL